MKKRQSPEQIVAKLRQADIDLGKGRRVPEVCKQLGITEQTYYRWRQKYGGWIHVDSQPVVRVGGPEELICDASPTNPRTDNTLSGYTTVT